MIKVEHVFYSYKDGNERLKDIHFTIKEGETIAIVGKNGSGKSTLGRLLSGITKIKKGSITIDGLDISQKKNFPLIQEKIGIVFQNPENQIIFNRFYDEVAFSLPSLTKDEIKKRIHTVLEFVEMSSFKNHDLYTLSLGQKQRMVIAEALVKNPKYLILDEPTTMIDSLGKEKIYQILAHLKAQGYTLICITNLADEILLADRTLILSNGTIACEIKKEELLEKYFLFEQYGIFMPTLLDILVKLRKNGIKINLKDFSTTALVREITERIKYEKGSS